MHAENWSKVLRALSDGDPVKMQEWRRIDCIEFVRQLRLHNEAMKEQKERFEQMKRKSKKK